MNEFPRRFSNKLQNAKAFFIHKTFNVRGLAQIIYMFMPFKATGGGGRYSQVGGKPLKTT